MNSTNGDVSTAHTGFTRTLLEGRCLDTLCYETKVLRIVYFALFLFLPGCSSSPTTSVDPDLTLAPDGVVFGASVVVGYTHIRADGNRVVQGQGRLPTSTAVDVPLRGKPAWVVAVPAAKGGTLWAVALADGRTQGFLVVGGKAQAVAALDGTLPAGAPPALASDAAGPRLLPGTFPDASPLSNPVLLPRSRRVAYLTKQGDVVVRGPDGAQRLDIDALPDARLLVDPDDRLLVLTDPTTRYGHGVLGDRIEAAGVRVIATRPTLKQTWRYSVASPAVIEGLSPLWADLDGDKKPEVVVTISDDTDGARLVVLRPPSTSVVARSAAIGTGFRWRHQLAVTALQTGAKTPELIEVVTPHLGRSTRTHQLQGSKLVQTSQLTGPTSHFIGSRVLDMALCADLTGDGAREILLVKPDRSGLTALERTQTGLKTAFTVSLGGTLSTNLAAAADEDGHLVLGAGRDDGVLRLWP